MRRRSYPDPAGPRPAGCSPSAGEETERDSDEVEAATTMNPCFCFLFCFFLNQAQIVKTTGGNLEQKNQQFNYSIINQLWKQSRANKQVIQSLFEQKTSFYPSAAAALIGSGFKSNQQANYDAFIFSNEHNRFREGGGQKKRQSDWQRRREGMKSQRAGAGGGGG